jgi:hypothetical protein
MNYIKLEYIIKENMKKLIITLLITTAFNLAYGMEKEEKTTNLNKPNSFNQLKSNSIMKGLVGLASTIACGYLAYRSLVSDSNNYKKARQASIITIDDGSFTKKEISITIPKTVVSILPIIATCFLAKYSFNQFQSIFAQPTEKA